MVYLIKPENKTVSSAFAGSRSKNNEKKTAIIKRSWTTELSFFTMRLPAGILFIYMPENKKESANRILSAVLLKAPAPLITATKMKRSNDGINVMAR